MAGSKIGHRERLLLEGIKAGMSRSHAAAHAGISRQALYRWIDRGRNGRSVTHVTFYEKLCQAEEEAFLRRPKADPRHLARSRYEHQVSPAKLKALVIDEVRRTIREGKVPTDVASEAIQEVSDLLFDELAEQSVSWAENPAKARCHPGSRGLYGDEED